MNFLYTSTAGFTANVPATIHKMVQRGVVFNLVNGAKLTKECKFVVTDAPVKLEVAVDKTIAAAKANRVVKAKPTKVAGKKSNADLMRNYVAVAKANNATLEDCIAYGINDLAQNKSTAKKYATDIWNKTK